jgi:hypothetical protein
VDLEHFATKLPPRGIRWRNIAFVVAAAMFFLQMNPHSIEPWSFVSAAMASRPNKDYLFFASEHDFIGQKMKERKCI